MNLNEIINKIEPEACNGTGYKHTVDELVMQVIGELYVAYANKKVINSDMGFIFALTNAFIKIVQICKIQGRSDFDKEIRLRQDVKIMNNIIHYLFGKHKHNYMYCFKALIAFCNHHKIDILKHVEGRLK